MKFANLKSRKPLIDALNKVIQKHGLTVPEQSNNTSVDELEIISVKEQFVEWMKTPHDGKTYKESTINRYVRALETLCAQISDLDVDSTDLFYYETLESFKEVDRLIRANRDFDRVNRASSNGNGDLSAGMTKYMDFLVSREESVVKMGMQKEGEEIMSDAAKLERIKKYISSKGFTFNDGIIENYYICLKCKPFVILAGTSGTGKTKLVKLFSEAICAEYKLIPVRPDWSDSSDLFGHTNLQGEFVPGAITEFVKSAIDHPDSPFILCLDEMNLARVEYYFSDFLSPIETRRWNGDSIESDEISMEATGKAKYGPLYIPENLYFVGTVNMDETTYPFSKKVLDRANTIEFSDVNLIPSFDAETEPVDPISVGKDFLKTKYLTLLTDIDESQKPLVIKVCTELQTINEILRKANSHVGYRVRDEIVFYMINNDEYKILEYEDALDFEIMQKILPRIQGSTDGIKDLLIELFKKCAGDYSSFSRDCIWMQMNDYLKNKASVYPKSAKKICYMMRRFEEDGFTSYWL